MFKFLAAIALVSTTYSASAVEAIKGMRPTYKMQGVDVVPVDIESIDVNYVFDVENKSAIGVATLYFQNLKAGYPSFDLEREILSASIGSEDVTLNQ